MSEPIVREQVKAANDPRGWELARQAVKARDEGKPEEATRLALKALELLPQLPPDNSDEWRLYHDATLLAQHKRIDTFDEEQRLRGSTARLHPSSVRRGAANSKRDANGDPQAKKDGGADEELDEEPLGEDELGEVETAATSEPQADPQAGVAESAKEPESSSTPTQSGTNGVESGSDATTPTKSSEPVEASSAGHEPEHEPDAAKPTPRTEDPVALQDQLVEHLAATLPSDDPDLIAARLALAELLRLKGNLAAARQQYELALKGFLASIEKLQGKGLPPKVAAVGTKLGKTALDFGDFETADKTFGKLVAESGAAPSTDTEARVDAQNDQASAKIGLGDLDGASELYRDVYEQRSKDLAPDHPWLANARENLLSALAALRARVAAHDEKGEDEEATRVESSVLTTIAVLPPSDPDRIDAQRAAAARLARRCRLEEARDLREKIVEALRDAGPARAAELTEALRELAAIERVLDRTERARALEREIESR